MTENDGTFKRFKKNAQENNRGDSPRLFEKEKVFSAGRAFFAVFVLLLALTVLLLLLPNRPVVTMNPAVPREREEPRARDVEAETETEAEDYFIKGMSEYNSGDLKGAVKNLKKSLELNASNKKASLYLEEVLSLKPGKRVLNVGQVPAGPPVKESGIEKTHSWQQTCDMYYRKGRVFYENGDFVNARYYWEKVIKIIDDPADQLYKQAEAKLEALKKTDKK